MEGVVDRIGEAAGVVLGVDGNVVDGEEEEGVVSADDDTVCANDRDGEPIECLYRIGSIRRILASLIN